MKRARILVVDDELIMRESLSGWLNRDGHEVETAASGEEALDKIKEVRFDILLVDIKMEGISGLDVLKRVKDDDPDVAIVMITAFGSISTAIDAIKNGAFDYLLKPFDPHELGVLIEKIQVNQAQAIENLYLREQFKERTRFESLIGQSPVMQKIFDLIQNVAPTNSTVLITGDTGTGKGLAAKAIHSNSPRCHGPFVIVNCGAIPEHLMESELFGYQKGAFTDAKSTKKGRLEMAHGGTLFLDEIGDLTPATQVKLLRVLQEREFERLGGTETIKINVRVICATHRDLDKMVREDKFREDLYYRINVFSLVIPPLRDRKEDISLLVEHFIKKYSKGNNKKLKGISKAALNILMNHNWQGNVRELENVVERAVVLCKKDLITPQELPPNLVSKEKLNNLESGGITLPEIVEALESQKIKDALEKCKTQRNAAKFLGITERMLGYKRQKYKIGG